MGWDGRLEEGIGGEGEKGELGREGRESCGPPTFKMLSSPMLHGDCICHLGMSMLVF